MSKQLIEEETVEVDPPSGRFQAVARCGLSGVWLGPPNHHSYQTNLRRLHRERFGHLPFEVYAAKVRTERNEEAVNAWLETMKQKVRWRVRGDAENAWMDDRTEAERAVATRCFETAYAEVRIAEVSGAIAPGNISPALLSSLRMVGSHASKHPAILIPAVCRALEAERMPVFKRLGKLHTGPARPHSLAPEVVLAERPAAMVEWIRNHKPAKLAGLWQAVLPEGATEPTPEYAADLFWLLHQGHILLYADDALALQEPREVAPPEKVKEPKQPNRPKADKTVVATQAENPAAAPPPRLDEPTVAVSTDEAGASTDNSLLPPESSAPDVLSEFSEDLDASLATPEASIDNPAEVPPPEFTPELTPEVTPEVAPEVTPEGTPEGTPEVATASPPPASEGIPMEETSEIVSLEGTRTTEP
ncbi:MAG: hypothetical protein NTW21_33930 [Verrucomicrobia bacterium]|nr:hypothetical protein [Verrucomicrobiota bacterium]